MGKNIYWDTTVCLMYGQLWYMIKSNGFSCSELILRYSRLLKKTNMPKKINAVRGINSGSTGIRLSNCLVKTKRKRTKKTVPMTKTRTVSKIFCFVSIQLIIWYVMLFLRIIIGTWRLCVKSCIKLCGNKNKMTH